MTKEERIEQLHQYLDTCMNAMVRVRLAHEGRDEDRDFVFEQTNYWLEKAYAVIGYERFYIDDITTNEAGDMSRMVRNVFDNCNCWEKPFEGYED